MSRKEDDELLILLEHNLLLAEKVSVLTNQIALLLEVIRWQDGLDKRGIEACPITVPGLEGGVSKNGLR